MSNALWRNKVVSVTLESYVVKLQVISFLVNLYMQKVVPSCFLSVFLHFVFHYSMWHSQILSVDLKVYLTFLELDIIKNAQKKTITIHPTY